MNVSSFVLRPGRTIGNAVFLLIALTAGAALADAPAASGPNLRSRADEVSKLFRADPGGYDALFAPSFLAAVPADKITAILRACYAQMGRCINVQPAEGAKKYEGQFQFEFEKGFTAPISLALDPAPPHLITGFFIGAPAAAANSLDDVISELKKLPGTTSLFVGSISKDELKPIAQYNADKPLAIGSTFKLYVLAELIRQIDAGERHWSDVIPLDDASRSLPSGFLQKWPVGSPLTVHTLAGLMISQSDNTAVDEMIHTLSRAKVEQVLAPAGMAEPKRDIPFLTTLEMFKLKSDAGAKLMADFLAGSATDRLKLLDGPVAQMSRDAVEPYATPRHIADAEWFASTSDLARVMNWIRQHAANDRTSDARGILAINSGLSFAEGQWKYIGYKGGSEPGVVNMTYLLESTNGKWFTVSATWNDPDHPVEEARFFALVKRAVELTK